jgi:hypothetical protein
MVNLFVEPPNDLQGAVSRVDCKEWQATITTKLASLDKNKTWTLTSLIPNQKPIGSKWDLKIKTKVDGTLDKCKARLVVRGCTKVHEIDYTETFFLVVKLNSIKVLFALATQHDLEIHHLDVRTAFLNGFIKEDIYMRVPKGYGHVLQHGFVRKLNKSLHRLKQSSRAWYQRLDLHLLLQGYHRLDPNANIYKKKKTSNNGFTILTVYVNDCIVVNNKLELIKELKDIFAKRIWHVK